MGEETVLIPLLILGVAFMAWAWSRQKRDKEDIEREKRLAELNRLDARDGRFQGRTGPLE